ncbi:MAG TPA: hypothetical protein VFK66_10195 [Oryzihumus sp.]|nr:hypothetical protein [Oryzihumus sp.]
MDQVSTPLSSRIRHGLHPDFREVAAQLHRDFDLLTGAEVVDRILDEVAGRFADARVRTFLPLLVHRYARSDLRSVTPAPGGAMPGRASGSGVASQASSAG